MSGNDGEQTPRSAARGAGQGGAGGTEDEIVPLRRRPAWRGGPNQWRKLLDGDEAPDRREVELPSDPLEHLSGQALYDYLKQLAEENQGPVPPRGATRSRRAAATAKKAPAAAPGPVAEAPPVSGGVSAGPASSVPAEVTEPREAAPLPEESEAAAASSPAAAPPGAGAVVPADASIVSAGTTGDVSPGSREAEEKLEVAAVSADLHGVAALPVQAPADEAGQPALEPGPATVDAPGLGGEPLETVSDLDDMPVLASLWPRRGMRGLRPGEGWETPSEAEAFDSEPDSEDAGWDWEKAPEAHVDPATLLARLGFRVARGKGASGPQASQDASGVARRNGAVYPQASQDASGVARATGASGAQPAAGAPGAATTTSGAGAPQQAGTTQVAPSETVSASEARGEATSRGDVDPGLERIRTALLDALEAARDAEAIGRGTSDGAWPLWMDALAAVIDETGLDVAAAGRDGVSEMHADLEPLLADVRTLAGEYGLEDAESRIDALIARATMLSSSGDVGGAPRPEANRIEEPTVKDKQTAGGRERREAGEVEDILSQAMDWNDEVATRGDIRAALHEVVVLGDPGSALPDLNIPARPDRGDFAEIVESLEAADEVGAGFDPLAAALEELEQGGSPVLVEAAVDIAVVESQDVLIEGHVEEIEGGEPDDEEDSLSAALGEIEGNLHAVSTVPEGWVQQLSSEDVQIASASEEVVPTLEASEDESPEESEAVTLSGRRTAPALESARGPQGMDPPSVGATVRPPMGPAAPGAPVGPSVTPAAPGAPVRPPVGPAAGARPVATGAPDTMRSPGVTVPPAGRGASVPVEQPWWVPPQPVAQGWPPAPARPAAPAPARPEPEIPVDPWADPRNRAGNGPPLERWVRGPAWQEHHPPAASMPGWEQHGPPPGAPAWPSPGAELVGAPQPGAWRGVPAAGPGQPRDPWASTGRQGWPESPPPAAAPPRAYPGHWPEPPGSHGRDPEYERWRARQNRPLFEDLPGGEPAHHDADRRLFDWPDAVDLPVREDLWGGASPWRDAWPPVSRPVPPPIPTPPPQAPVSDRRSAPRLVGPSGVVYFRCQGRIATGDLGNLSITGAMIRTRTPVQPGASIPVALELPALVRPLRVVARVVYIRKLEPPHQGQDAVAMGVAFEQLDPEDRHTLLEYLSRFGR